MRVKVESPVEGTFIFNLSAWSHMRVGGYGYAHANAPGTLVIGLPTIEFVVQFSDTNADNPINGEVIVDLIDASNPGDGVFTMEDFEQAYREELAQFNRRALIRPALGS